MEHDADWDVLVIGRSYAGLAAALTAGRARRSVLVVGEGGPRNEAVLHVHGFPTRDGASPAEMVELAERELERYPNVRLESGRVTELSGSVGSFHVRFGPQRTTAATVVLATGVNDTPPAVPGLAEHWGRGVFTCPFCDGWEHQDLHLGVIGPVAHLGLMLTGWSDRVTVLGDPDDDATAALEARGVAIERREVRRVIGTGSAIEGVELADGDRIDLGALFVAGVPTPNSALGASLGCDLDPGGFVVVDAMGATSVPGVHAAGDLTEPGRHQISLAVASAVAAASSCVRLLLF